MHPSRSLHQSMDLLIDGQQVGQKGGRENLGPEWTLINLKNALQLRGAIWRKSPLPKNYRLATRNYRQRYGKGLAGTTQSRPRPKVRNTGVSTVMSNQLILSVQQPYQVAPAADVPDVHSHLDFKSLGVLHEGVESSTPFAERRSKVHPTHKQSIELLIICSKFLETAGDCVCRLLPIPYPKSDIWNRISGREVAE